MAQIRDLVSTAFIEMLFHFLPGSHIHFLDGDGSRFFIAGQTAEYLIHTLRHRPKHDLIVLAQDKLNLASGKQM